VLTLREVSEVIQRMASSQRQFSGTAEQLNHLALSIQLLAQSFRVASSHSLKHQVMEGAAGLASAIGKPEAVERRLQDMLLAHPYAEMAYLVDQDGVMMAFAVNPELGEVGELPAAVKVGRSYADRPWFQAVRRDGRTAVTPLYDSLFTGEPCFSIASPVSDLDGTTAGTLGLDVNVRNWTRI
jgi:methyl-accepting chemotaxis protein